MSEFKIVSQYLDAVDPVNGPVMEELRTLLIKKSAESVEKVQQRAKWEKFGKAKTQKSDGVTNVSREEVLIEPPLPLWGDENNDQLSSRLVSAVGKVSIRSRESAGTPTPATPTPGHSRRNSGSSLPDMETPSRTPVPDSKTLPGAPTLK